MEITKIEKNTFIAFLEAAIIAGQSEPDEPPKVILVKLLKQVIAD